MKQLLLFILFFPLIARGQDIYTTHLKMLMQQQKATAGGGGGGITVNNAWKTNGANQIGVVNVAATAGRNLVTTMGAGAGSSANHVVGDNIDGTTGWTKCTNINGAVVQGSMWVKFNIPSGIIRVTNNAGASATHTTAFVHEFSGGTGAFTVTEAGSTNASVSGTVVQTITVNNGTAASIVFASSFNNSGGNPAVFTLNTAGTVGTYLEFDATKSKETDGSQFTTGECAYQILSSSANQRLVWTEDTASQNYVMMNAIFH